MGDSEEERPAFAKRWTFARVVRMLPWRILIWGAFGTVIGLIKVIWDTGAAQKARIVAAVFSEAMNCVAPGALVLFLLYLLASFLVARFFHNESGGNGSRRDE